MVSAVEGLACQVSGWLASILELTKGAWKTSLVGTWKAKNTRYTPGFKLAL